MQCLFSTQEEVSGCGGTEAIFHGRQVGEEDRVKFLQEAAIMGQFKHPHVVEMYGMITLGQPDVSVKNL